MVTGGGVVTTGSAAPEVKVPVIVPPSPPRHCVVIEFPLSVNVTPVRYGVVSPGCVNTTEATLPLAVPLTFERPSPHPEQTITSNPVTVDPVCVSVIDIGTPGLGPNVPAHVPLNGPEAEGAVGEEEPPPQAIATARVKVVRTSVVMRFMKFMASELRVAVLC